MFALDDLPDLEIVGAEQNGMYLGKWRTKWSAIECLRDYLTGVMAEAATRTKESLDTQWILNDYPEENPMAARSSKKTQADLILPPPYDMKLRVGTHCVPSAP
jgi:hypothetical protein